MEVLSSTDIEELKAAYSPATIHQSVPHVLKHLAELLNASGVRDFFKFPNTFSGVHKFWNELNEEVRNDLRACVGDAIKHNTWNALVAHSALRSGPKRGLPDFIEEGRLALDAKLVEAYKTKYVGTAAIDFIRYIEVFEHGLIYPTRELYAKTIPVIQSSGTGKSRMLTEVGEIVFTLPICLRKPVDPGYPRSDRSVWAYFEEVTKVNNLSISGHHALACFIAAAHGQMLESLKELRNENQNEPLDANGLRKRWHECMETEEGGAYRQSFFETVKVKAEKLKEGGCPFVWRSGSPGGNPDKGFKPQDMAETIYNKVAKTATKDLMDFITVLSGGQRALCVTYIDEAHELGMLYWALLRLLNHQDSATAMWYSFMGTKSDLHNFAPRPENLQSLRLLEELIFFVPPFYALPFDVHTSSSQRLEVKNYCMGEFRTVKHIAQYGRPLWLALILHDEDRKISLEQMVKIAKAKLLNNKSLTFYPRSEDHVFTILSQRICLEPTLANREAISLVNRSVANHMRLITGFSHQRSMIHTYSPSEPILSLGAISALYNAYEDGPLTLDTLRPVLTTFTQGLCKTGIIDKGQLGEIAARVLLLTARDVTAVKQGNGDFLKPVRLLDVLDSLLCKDEWEEGEREEFETPFSGAYVNFMHWIVTEENLPDVPDEDLLANLWSRHAILQCSHNQGTHDFVAAAYFGDVTDGAVFDPTKLAPFYGHVKLKIRPDTNAAGSLRPIGIPRVTNLPHLAILMEPETNAWHKRIQRTISSSVSDESFYHSQKELLHARAKLLALQDSGAEKADIDKQKKEVEEKQKVLDGCNQYMLTVRGTPYGILREAKIETEFERLLDLIDRLEMDKPEKIQTMMPLRRFNRDTAYTAWMHRFVTDPEAMLN